MKFFHAVLRPKSLLADDSASVGIIFGISFIPVMLTIGAALDYSKATTLKSRMQTATDSAAIAVANSNPALSQSARQSIALNAVTTRLASVTPPISFTVTETEPGGGIYQVNARADVPTSFMRLASVGSIPVSVTSKAKVTFIGGGKGAACVLSLNTSAVNAVWGIGSASVVLSNCDIYGNSSNTAALDVGGSSTLTVRGISVVGNVEGLSQITTVPRPNNIRVNQQPMSDPYRNLIPAYSGLGSRCDYTGFSANSTMTLDPGIYCNGFQLNSKANVTLNPGLYVMDRGSFQIAGQATLTGNGVTIVFTSSTGSNWPQATINGGANVNLTAPPSSAGNDMATGVPGVVIYGDRAMAQGTSYKFNGGGTESFVGAIYLPKAALTYNGNTEAPTDHSCLQIIADTITFTGNANLALNGCDAFGITYFGTPATAIATSALVQ